LAVPDFGHNSHVIHRVPLAEFQAMALTVEATYENGVLKPVQPLPSLAEGARVWLTVHIAAEEDRVRKAYGLLGWTGDAETVQRVALDPEFDILGSP
jgi:predicted DNA-binding antitoxin AbrB/MazE fold protein